MHFPMVFIPINRYLAISRVYVQLEISKDSHIHPHDCSNPLYVNCHFIKGNWSFNHFINQVRPLVSAISRGFFQRSGATSTWTAFQASWTTWPWPLTTCPAVWGLATPCLLARRGMRMDAVTRWWWHGECHRLDTHINYYNVRPPR